MADSGEAQFHGVFGVLLAELRRRGGDLDGARAAIDEALDRIEFCTEDAMRLARVAAVGVVVEADRAQRGRDLGDAEETRRALLDVQDYLLRVEAAAAEGRPLESAWLATRRRARRAPAARTIPRCGTRPRRAGRRSGAASRPSTARWRQAEALVLRDDREAAAGSRRPRSTSPAAAGRATSRASSRRSSPGRACGCPTAAPAGAAPTAPPSESDDPFGLTPRERQVLALVARGATNREIGAELFMAEKTASVHVSRILAKLDVRSRTAGRRGRAPPRAGRLVQPGEGAERDVHRDERHALEDRRLAVAGDLPQRRAVSTIAPT